MANATAIAFGIDPAHPVFQQEVKRAHLDNCLKEEKIAIFPTANESALQVMSIYVVFVNNRFQKVR